MVKFLLALVLLSTGLKYTSGFGNFARGYEVSKPLLESEKSQEQKSGEEKSKVDHGDNLHVTAHVTPAFFPGFLNSPKNFFSSKSYTSLVQRPNTPPPNEPIQS